MAKTTKIIMGLLILFSLFTIPIANESHITTTNQKMVMDQYLEQPTQSNLFGILEIPQINLKQPVYPQDNQENNVDKNVTLLKETMSENGAKGNIILASHSGNGIHAYFKNLNQLEMKTPIYFYYQENKYEYILLKKEEVPKTGTVYLQKYNFPHLILITCSKTKNDIQEIYYAKMLKKV